MPFANLGLSDAVLKAVAESGYTTPTPVQEQVIPLVLMGRDVLGFAPTGTGKTASFILPMLDILSGARHRARMPRSIILSPTRELATQIAENFDTYGKYSTLSKALLIGGVGFEEQEKLLDRGVDVLIATPGRLMDHHQQGRILLNDVKLLVIDEADRMLDMGFIPDIEKIVSFVPTIRQTLMFSATMPDEILRLAKKFLMNPKEVKVERAVTNATPIEQFYVKAPSDFKAKRGLLRDVINHLQVKNAYIFCNRKKDVDILCKSLQKHGFAAGAMHGDMDQFDRNKTFDEFKSGKITMLVCSDVAARGLDVMDVSHVVNFDVPWNTEDYVHRTGRTGRAGKTGCAVMLVTKHEDKSFEPIKKLAGDLLKVLPLESAEIMADSDGEETGEPTRHHNRQHRRNRSRHGRRQPGSGGRPHHNRPHHGIHVHHGEFELPRDDEPADNIGNRIADDDNSIPDDIGNRASADESPANFSNDRGEGQSRGRRRRGGRGRNRNRDRDRDGSQSENREQRSEQRPPRENQYPRERGQTYNERRENNQNRQNRDRSERRDNRTHRQDREPSPKGLGDHVPAFLVKK
ncbi:MAG: DEAD/DEAH box helicase [Alphaproteobacteria bacterium]|nr:MAG: DEAD/DEAH box helicase [Alphaproteobacteria bacterium]